MKKIKKIFPLLGIILIVTVAVFFYESCSSKANNPISGGGRGSLIDTGDGINVTPSAWSLLGGAVFSAGRVEYTSLATDNSGTPYVAYSDYSNDNKAVVMKYNTSSDTWVALGGEGFTEEGAWLISLAFDSAGIPYVAYSDEYNNDKMTVMKYSASSDTWVTLGGAGFSEGEVFDISLAIDSSGIPYVAYSDENYSYKATVMKFNGMSWDNVGIAGFSAGEVWSTGLAFDSSGILYIAYRDDANGEKTVVMKFNGISWENVGAAGFSEGEVWYTSLAIDSSDTLYVAYQDNANGEKTSVMKFNGISWDNVGTAGFSAGAVKYVSFAIDSSDTPYVAYRDYANGYKATVMKFNGISWENVGAAGFSQGESGYTSLAFNNSGEPIVAYVNTSNDDEVIVMKYGN